ncbi:hypothetical protein [Porphyrobacter sp. AAP60]|uniref:hypothetical protein n=1 Tax=Porphyrobacter sp. AAP60 TaxID=1523423 RepID=UPI000ABC244A|nr:hypothetical protein [Porphyrobacter sp. AAP60]
MINRRLALLPLLALAGTSLSGCVAVAIPALAGSAIVGSRVDGKDGSVNPDAALVSASASQPAVAVAPSPPSPTIEPPASPASTVQVPAIPAVASAVTTPAPVVAAAPTVLPPPPAPAPATPPAAAAAPNAAPPISPTASQQTGFAQFVRYGRNLASGTTSDKGALSAMLADPIELDGKRRQCAAGEQPVALIDLDPAGGVFDPPANPEKQPGLALGLAVMREAGVVIAWLSDLSVNRSGGLRTALEQSGLDPRGEDIISLSRDGTDRKQLRMENLAGITCIIAIAGDERADFDERYKYLRNPEAGAGLENVIGDGWFLIDQVFPDNKGEGQ